MKSIYLCLIVFCAAIAVSGCGEAQQESTLADGGVTADEIAHYEADLAAVTGDEAYEDATDDDDAAE